MSADTIAPPGGAPQPAPGHASGQGAVTALEALIRQRKRAETPEQQQLTPPPAPPPAAP